MQTNRYEDLCETLIDDREHRSLKEIEKLKIALDQLAATINFKRAKAIPKLTSALENILSSLGMPNAKFNITFNATDEYFYNGKDQLSFLFSKVVV